MVAAMHLLRTVFFPFLALLLAPALAACSGGETPLDTPIEAPSEKWTWVPFSNAFCANGDTTGIGVNLTSKSKRVVVYLEGGGACWDENTCYALGASQHVASGYGEDEFDADFTDELPIVETANIFDRKDPGNPFRDMSFVYIPYCTGDLHGGDNVVTYGDHTTHHAGAADVAAFLKRIVPTFPDAERVILAGASAGAYGASFNWWRVQEAFGDVRVDLLNDSGPPLDPPYLSETYVKDWRDHWKLNQVMPPDCAGCQQSFGALFDYYGEHFGANRAALLSYTTDSILPIYFDITKEQGSEGIAKVVVDHFDPYPSFHAFLAEGESHVLLTAKTPVSTRGVKLQEWLGQMVNDDPAWTSVHP